MTDLYAEAVAYIYPDLKIYASDGNLVHANLQTRKFDANFGPKECYMYSDLEVLMYALDTMKNCKSDTDEIHFEVNPETNELIVVEDWEPLLRFKNNTYTVISNICYGDFPITDIDEIPKEAEEYSPYDRDAMEELEVDIVEASDEDYEYQYQTDMKHLMDM